MKRSKTISLIIALILSLQTLSVFAGGPPTPEMKPDVPYTVNSGSDAFYVFSPEESGDYVLGCIDETEGVVPGATIENTKENLFLKTENGRRIVHLTRGMTYVIKAFCESAPESGGSFTLMIKMSVKADSIYLLPTETGFAVGDKTILTALFDPWYGAPERIIFEAENGCAKIFRNGAYNVAEVVFAEAGEVTVRAFCDSGLSTSVTFSVSPAPVVVKCDGVELGEFTPGDEIELPVPDTLVKDGAVRRFFTWAGAEVKRSEFDRASGTPNGRTYTMTVPDGGAVLTPVYVWVGDLSGDDLVTVADVAEMKNMISSAIDFGDPAYEASDINFDGLTTLADLASFKGMLSGNYSPER